MSRYTCHTENRETAPRVVEHHVADGYIYHKQGGFETRTQCLKKIRTEWKAILCGHITSNLDGECNGCEYRR